MLQADSEYDRGGNLFPLGALEPHFDNLVESGFLSPSGSRGLSVATVFNPPVGIFR